MDRGQSGWFTAFCNRMLFSLNVAFILRWSCPRAAVRTAWQTDRQTETDRQTGKQAGRQAGTQADRQTGRQTEDHVVGQLYPMIDIYPMICIHIYISPFYSRGYRDIFSMISPFYPGFLEMREPIFTIGHRFQYKTELMTWMICSTPMTSETFIPIERWRTHRWYLAFLGWFFPALCLVRFPSGQPCLIPISHRFFPILFPLKDGYIVHYLLFLFQMKISWNGVTGTPKSSVLMGFSTLN